MRRLGTVRRRGRGGARRARPAARRLRRPCRVDAAGRRGPLVVGRARGRGRDSRSARSPASSSSRSSSRGAPARRAARGRRALRDPRPGRRRARPGRPRDPARHGHARARGDPAPAGPRAGRRRLRRRRAPRGVRLRAQPRELEGGRRRGRGPVSAAGCATSRPRTAACRGRPRPPRAGHAAARRLGELFRAGHESLRDDFEVSTPELDLLVELAYERRRARRADDGRRLRRLDRRARRRRAGRRDRRGRRRRLPRARGRAAVPRVCHASDGARELSADRGVGLRVEEVQPLDVERRPRRWSPIRTAARGSKVAQKSVPSRLISATSSMSRAHRGGDALRLRRRRVDGEEGRAGSRRPPRRARSPPGYSTAPLRRRLLAQRPARPPAGCRRGASRPTQASSPRRCDELRRQRESRRRRA